MAVKQRFYRRMTRNLAIFLSVIAGISNSYAANRTVDLALDYQTVNFTGKPAKAIAVNGQIPAPTLHFKEGDTVMINVHNHLDKPTSIHWHGLILPWQMDGVAGVSQQPIPPGGVFHYQFPLKQSGTYWYHAHAGLQEQQGVYGAFIIDPKQSTIKATKDIPIVLSDWTNTDPEKVYANLKKDGDYYSPRFPLQPSLQHFIKTYQTATPKEREELKNTYAMMQAMRMSPYDFSDVAYDTFLLNGHPANNPWKALVKVGDTVRLRFIDAGASTLFRVKIPGQTLHVVHVQGNDIKPYDTDSLTITPGETYDVLVKITQHKPYIIYIESSDKLGKVYGALVTDAQQALDVNHIKAFPMPKPEMGGHNMAGHSMPGMTNTKMDHAAMAMQDNTMPMAHAGMDMANAMPASRAGMQHDMAALTMNKYQDLKATHKTNDPNKPVHPIQMVLSGYMDKYLWFINGLPEYKAKPILLQKGERYRITFINQSMMHHPMHIHGHWFILRNGYGAFDPKLHTIDVAPGETITVDVDADASGQWIFHCHNLYHMKAGMGVLLRYEDAKTTAVQEKNQEVETLLSHSVAHEANWYHDTRFDIGMDFKGGYETTFKTRIGNDYHKLELYAEELEINKGKVEHADADVFYWHLISEFWAVKGGLNYVYRPAQKPYVQPGIGIEGLMPYFIDTDVRAYVHKGSTRLDVQLSRDNQLTNNFFIRTGIRGIAATKTMAEDEIGSGLNTLKWSIRPYYRLKPGINLYTEFSHTDYYGTLKRLRGSTGGTTRDDTVTVGISWLF